MDVSRLEQEIQQLSREELAAFREWFVRYDSEEWDRQIEDDALSGRLDALASEALTAHEAGKTREL